MGIKRVDVNGKVRVTSVCSQRLRRVPSVQMAEDSICAVTLSNTQVLYPVFDAEEAQASIAGIADHGRRRADHCLRDREGGFRVLWHRVCIG